MLKVHFLIQDKLPIKLWLVFFLPKIELHKNRHFLFFFLHKEITTNFPLPPDNYHTQICQV